MCSKTHVFRDQSRDIARDSGQTRPAWAGGGVFPAKLGRKQRDRDQILEKKGSERTCNGLSTRLDFLFDFLLAICLSSESAMQWLAGGLQVTRRTKEVNT